MLQFIINPMRLFKRPEKDVYFKSAIKEPMCTFVMTLTQVDYETPEDEARYKKQIQ